MYGDDDYAKMFGPQPQMPSLGDPDLLPTHPERKAPESMRDQYDYQVKVRQFDLSKEEDRTAYEEITTKFLYGTAIELKQRWASDKDAGTMIAMSWINLIPKRARKGPGAAKKGNPWRNHGENPGVPDGAYPGQGATVDPPSGDEEE